MTYHLEDGSVDIWEPRSENSGLEQGRILHRMRVPNQHGAGGVMTPGDFNVGCSPIIFKREYHVLACDAFTRAFLEREGFVVPNELPFPTERDPKPPKGQFPSAPSRPEVGRGGGVSEGNARDASEHGPTQGPTRVVKVQRHHASLRRVLRGKYFPFTHVPPP